MSSTEKQILDLKKKNDSSLVASCISRYFYETRDAFALATNPYTHNNALSKKLYSNNNSSYTHTHDHH